jgi:uncharacterized protein YcbK (DUF882 family)
VSAKSALYASGLAALVLTFGSRGLQNAIAEGDTRTISLHHMHTDEDITITFKREGRYDEAALDKLNWFLRDWRREEQTRMDPHLIDLIWEVERETGSKAPVWVVCGYRSPQTNAMLRRRSGGVARFSQHMLGHAMDFYIPGVSLEQLRVIGLRLQRGGVGFYPTSGSPFVHMDTGNVRHWPRMTREQLVRVFPDGRTVHIPVDGKPLSGYALALADIRRNGATPSEMSVDAARSAGVDVADAGNVAQRGRNLFARLFGFHKDEEDDDSEAPAATATASNAPAPAAAEPLRARAKAAVVAALDRAGDKLATEKAKLVQVAQAAAKVHMITRAEAATLPDPPRIADATSRVAMLTPNEIIKTRGYWEGLPDGMIAGRPSAAAAVAAIARDRGAEHAAEQNAERVVEHVADATGTVGAFAGAREDRVPPALALAYAEQPERDATPRSAAAKALAAAAVARATTTGAVAAQIGQDDTTIAVKRVSGRPASVILTVANKVPSVGQGSPLDDPWVRAIARSPSVHHFLTITALGARDFRSLAPLMVKPDSSVMMTFGADTQLGLTDDRFTGSAIVFVPTVSYPIRSASLQ